MKEEARAALTEYLARHPQETSVLARLVNQLATDAGDMADRGNMLGHFTASALVLNAAETHVLFINHLVLQRWLQPGGHVEADDSLWAAAIREVLEETGVENIVSLLMAGGRPIALDIDTHTIDANPKKGEGPHFHHDFMFLAKAPENAVLTPQLAEVGGVKWLPLAEAAQLPNRRLKRVMAKLQEQLDAKFAEKLARVQSIVNRKVTVTGAAQGLVDKVVSGLCTSVVATHERHVDVVLDKRLHFGLCLDEISDTQVSGRVMSLSPFIRTVQVAQ